MSTWSLAGDGQDCWLDRTSRSGRVCVGLRFSPEAAPKSVPLDALAKHLGVRQRGLKL